MRKLRFRPRKDTGRPLSQRRTQAWPLRFTGLIVGVGVAAAGALTFLALNRPQFFNDYHSPNGITLTPDQAIVVEKNRADARTSGREAGLKLAAGVGALAAALVGWGRLELSKDERDSDRAAQYADRYTKAIDQLGSDKPDIQLGGIYALEALARATSGLPRRSSVEDYGTTIAEVLCALVRAYAPKKAHEHEPHADEPVSRHVQSALTVLGRNTWPTHLDLRGANLTRAQLAGTTFHNVDLSDANLYCANLNHADLSGAILSRVFLRGANLSHANLAGARLWQANLSDTGLTSAQLSGAELNSADLTQAYLFETDLTGATLSDAKLNRAILVRANLADAKLFGVDLTAADLTETDLARADLRGATLDANPKVPGESQRT